MARLAVEAGRGVISHESIYRFIYRQLARTKDYGWRHYLPRAKWKRGWRGRKGGSPASFMALRRPLAERPQSAADRRTPGHWEADLMLFRTYGQAVLTLHERYSRILIPSGPLARHPAPSPAPCAVARSVAARMAPDDLRRDRFARYRPSGRDLLLRYPLPLAGRMPLPVAPDSAPQDSRWCHRRGLPHDSGLQQHPAPWIRTPAEIFWDSVLHLKCESTCPLSRERRLVVIGSTPRPRPPLTDSVRPLFPPPQRSAWPAVLPGRQGRLPGCVGS